MPKSNHLSARGLLPKCPTGIRGLDEITFGGLPRGRLTLVCGGPGAGKTLLAAEFLARGARDFGEPGVLVTFEERSPDLIANTAALGLDLDGLARRKKLVIDQVLIDRGEVLESGEYNLDGLFIRLGAAIDSVRAKRVVLDHIEALFGALDNIGVLRSEIRRLFAWLREKGVTSVVTAERGEGGYTRHALEEYISDCVILLDQRVSDQIATRRLRVVKYRGSMHGTNEYPFLIDKDGFLILPITNIKLTYGAPGQSVSSGVRKLDAMLDGKGFFRGSSVLVSGTAGTGKTSLSARFVEAACQRGERALYCAFEESPAQITRNVRSIGIDLDRWVKRGLLRFYASRPASLGLETHISHMLKEIEEFAPNVVALDPVTSFDTAGLELDVRAMLMRVIDILKSREITTMLTSLSQKADDPEHTEVGISTLVDVWMLLRNLERGSERTRGLHIIKARGMSHSNQVREFLLTNRGADLQDIYIGPEGALTGSARMAQQIRDRAAAETSRWAIEQQQDRLERKGKALKARIAELEAEYAAEAHDIAQSIAQEKARQASVLAERSIVAAERERARPRRN